MTSKRGAYLAEACRWCGRPVYSAEGLLSQPAGETYGIHRGECLAALSRAQRAGMARAKSRQGKRLCLSLFPGIGLLDRAFEEAGWCVVRGPDLVWGGDVRTFHPPAGVFDLVIGGPPCQVHSAGAALARLAGTGPERHDLIPEYERCVFEAKPTVFVMECAPKSPAAVVEGYSVWSGLLHNRDFGAVQMRCRRWSVGCRGGEVLNLWRWLETEALHVPEKERAVLASGGDYPGRYREVTLKCGRRRRYPMHTRASNRTVREGLALQGLDAEFFGGETPFSVEGQQRLIGNGVPLMMGRAVAAAVTAAVEWLEGREGAG